MDATIRTTTEANRASWNSIAPSRPGQPAEFFSSGGIVLEDYEQELAGDVRGKRILQLACSCGDEVLSWANLGAIATGIDISDVAIQMATRKASEAGLKADFRRADIFDLPADLIGLDLIYLSWGAICWVPDLTTFAEIVATRLHPGGSVLLADHHPLWEVLAVEGENHLSVAGNYFARTTPRHTTETNNAKLPTGARNHPNPPPLSTFIWPTSDVITALLTANLHLTTFTESPAPTLYSALGPASAHLPATYYLKATKP